SNRSIPPCSWEPTLLLALAAPATHAPDALTVIAVDTSHEARPPLAARARGPCRRGTVRRGRPRHVEGRLHAHRGQLPGAPLLLEGARRVPRGRGHDRLRRIRLRFDEGGRGGEGRERGHGQ